MKFTIEEINLMCIYDCRSRKNLINELEESILYTDDNEIIQLIESATDKLYKMTDQEFSELTLVPAWEDEEDFNEKIDYELYQIKNGEEHRDYRFSSLRMLKHLQLQVDQKHYEKVYSGNVESNGSVGEVLESLYEKFNLQHPADYRSRSMSVSDIVVLHENGVDTAHFCDSVGFVEVPQFFLPAPTVNLETTGLSVDGHFGTWHTIGSFEIADKDFFMLEHDEFGASVANIVVDENGKLVAQDLWHGITPDIEHMIFEEQIKNPENYLAAAEGNSEENYNNIDGRIDTQSKLTLGDDTESHPEQLPEKKPSILAKLKDKQSELRKTSLESPETISPEKSKNKSELSLE